MTLGSKMHSKMGGRRVTDEAVYKGKGRRHRGSSAICARVKHPESPEPEKSAFVSNCRSDDVP